MIRRAVSRDIPRIIEIGTEALAQANLPGMVASLSRIEGLAKLGVESDDHFLWVAEDEDGVGGVLGVLVHDCLLYDRKQATIVQFECRIPGDGIKLLRECLRWWKKLPMVKMLMVSLECDGDPRIETLYERMGLHRRHPLMVATK